MTLIAGSKWLVGAGDEDEMYMTRSLNVSPKITEQRLIVRSDKSVAYVTNNKRLLDVFVLLKLTTARHEASRGLFVFVSCCVE